MKNLFNSPIGCTWLCLAFFLTLARPTLTFAQCVSPPAPIGLLANNAYQLAAYAGLRNYQWFRDTGSGPVAISGATAQTYEASQIGKYTWTAQDQFNCPAGTCCPAEFIPACEISIVSAVASACDRNSNTYDVAVTIRYAMGAMSNIVINGQSFTPSGLAGTQTFRVGRFYSEGASNKDITASIAGSGTCSANSIYNAPVNCRSGVVDPIGYIYCEQTGQLITGGTVSVVPPAGGAVTILENGSSGRYSWITNGVPGVYTMSYAPPAGYVLSTACLPQSGALDPTGQPDPYNLGAGAVSTVLTNSTCAANPFYLQFNLEIGDPLTNRNNIPLTCPCPSVFAAALAVNCTGNNPNSDGRLHLNTLTNVTHYGYSTGNTYTGPAYAAATAISGASDILTGIGNPASPQAYTIRVFNRNECFKDYNVTLQPKACVCPPIVCLDISSTRIR